MEDTLVIADLERLKVAADPLRQRLLAAFCCRAATTKQVAEELGEKPTRLYHHVDMLEKAGFLVLVETRQKRGTVEKYYQAAARNFIVDHQLLATADQDAVAAEAQGMAVNLLQAGLAEARDRFDGAAVRAGGEGRSMVLTQATLRLTREQALALIDRLCGCLDACCALEESAAESSEGRDFSLTVAFFPIDTGRGRSLTAGEPDES